MRNIITHKTKKVAKGQLLLNAGELATFGYLVINGCLKSYIIDPSGKEHILQFAPEGWIISDMDSFVHQKLFLSKPLKTVRLD